MTLDPSEVKLIRELARQDAIEFGEYVSIMRLTIDDSIEDWYDKFQQEKKEQAKQENK